MRAGRRHHRAQGSGGHDEREQAERHVKAAEQSGRGEDRWLAGQGGVGRPSGCRARFVGLAADHFRRTVAG